MESIKYCDICGKNYATDEHHLIGGTSERKICDQYYFMKLDLCRNCHDTIHKNNVANKLSKMLGQSQYEVRFSRKEYMREFKKNYLP